MVAIKGPGRAVCLRAVEIVGEELAHPRPEGDQPALGEFRVAHDQQLAREIDVTDAEAGDFAHAES